MSGVVVAAAVLAVLSPAVSPALASQLRVEFDHSSADLVISAFERRSLNDRKMTKVLDSGGYSLLFDHLSGRTQRPPEAWRADFRTALQASLDGEPEPGFALHRVRDQPALYRRSLREVRRVSASVRWRVLERLNGYLPPSTDFRSHAYFLVGGDSAGLAFGHRNDIALRLDDFVGTEPGKIDSDRLASVLTHELFHVGFRTAGGLPPRPAEFDPGWQQLALKYGSEMVGEVWRASPVREWDAEEIHERMDAWVPPAQWDLYAVDQFIALLAKLQNEGCATYVDAPLRDPGET
ncbi:MAG: hypothetical protein HKN12_05155, partial [Gemmatimonadetes bacterium]|nr:hypothetical protein [Gemmatimonadota bacterium]